MLLSRGFGRVNIRQPKLEKRAMSHDPTPSPKPSPPAGGITPTSPGLVLSVVIPVYNERFLVAELVRRVLAVEVPGIRAKELVIVDDCSRDGSRDILRRLAAEHPTVIRLLEQEKNQGKGAAVRRGIAAATGDLLVLQDADLEYDPRDYARLVKPFFEDGADVVYGSRYLPGERRRALNFRHTLGNRLLTTVSNWFTDLDLTDMETCYKMFRTPLLKSIPIRSNDFALEPEITAKIAKRECRVFEVPISYLGRTYREGKKIGWRDGFKAFWAMARFWLVDDIYAEDEYGSHILHRLEKAQRFNRWMAEAIARHAGSKVLEIGAGIGNITSWLLPRDRYLASDINPNYLSYLRNFATGKPYLEIDRIDLVNSATFDRYRGQFDTVICLNVLEHVAEPKTALRNLMTALEPGGKALIYVPQGPGLYSSLDEVLGHRCRYTREQLRGELEAAGFTVTKIEDFNRFGVPGWWWNGKVLRRRRFGRLQLKIFNGLVPILRRIDRYLPTPGLGLLAVATKP